MCICGWRMNKCGTKGPFSIMRKHTEVCAELCRTESVFCDRGVPGSIPNHPIWDLWWTKWQWDVASDYYGFHCHCHSASAPYSFICHRYSSVWSRHHVICQSVQLHNTTWRCSLPGTCNTPVSYHSPAVLQTLYSPSPQRESHIRYTINLALPGYVAPT